MAKFGAYEILQELSTGGMGAVLLGRRRGPGSFEQLVAIKTIRAEYAGAAAVRAMFLDEAAILARLNHPAVATVHDFGEQDGHLYMVMEYVAGVSFRAMVGVMSPAVAARAVLEACRGLHAAHELRDLGGQLLGLVHRDISPDNLMLGFDGHVKVIDFGIALVKNRQAPVTEFGTVKGKPPYMSPEQVKNETMDRRSDVFSLGVVLHEMLTGAPLFDGDSIYAIARAVEHQEIRPPSLAAGRELPLGLDAVVMNALDRDPARRTPTAAAFAEQLEQVISIAGDETLEAWADRELAAPRDAHRQWLAGVVTAGDLPRSPVGRATGSATQVGAAASKPSTEQALAASASLPILDEPERDTPTHLPGVEADDELDRPPRRNLALPVLLALVLLAAVVGGIVMFSRGSKQVGRDAGVVVAVADAAGDAAIDGLVVTAPPDAFEPEPDAALPPDATVARPPRDAGSRAVRRDAAIPAVAIDAAVIASPPTGFGRLTAKHKASGSFLHVLVDGKYLEATPIIGRKIPAGTHKIELVSPDTGVVLVSKTVTIVDGQSITISPP